MSDYKTLEREKKHFQSDLKLKLDYVELFLC